MSLLCLVITLSLTKKLNFHATDPWFWLAIPMCWFVSLRSFEVGVDRWLFIIPGVLVLTMIGSWPYSANHHFFFLWIAIPVLMRQELLAGESFSRYVSISMGIMMLAAGIQKLIGGHYLDGSYLAYLATAGGETENLLNLVCGGILTDERMIPCPVLVWLSRLSLMAQFTIGLLFLFEVRSRLVYTIEILFLLVVGTIADEWVFQAINLLCIIFVIRGHVPVWAMFGIIPFTLIGLHKLDNLILGVLA